jgi:flagellar biogenesis protein FliO
MTDVSFMDLMVRTLLALAVVLAIVGVGYVIARKRSNSMGSIGKTAAPRSSSVDAGARRFGMPKRRPTPLGVEIVARAGLARNSAVVALRFGDRVLLVSVAEQAPNTLLAEMSVDEWVEHTTARDAMEIPARPGSRSGSSSSSVSSSSVPPNVVSPTPSFIEALRQATARRD